MTTNKTKNKKKPQPAVASSDWLGQQLTGDVVRQITQTVQEALLRIARESARTLDTAERATIADALRRTANEHAAMAKTCKRVGHPDEETFLGHAARTRLLAREFIAAKAVTLL
jgi:hypothetical protein